MWFDRQNISPFVPEDIPTLNESAESLSQMVQEEIDNGTPMSRIIIGNTVYMYQRCRSGSESGGKLFEGTCKWGQAL